MATTAEAATRPHGRNLNLRKRPFSAFIRRIANFKNAGSNVAHNHSSKKNHNSHVGFVNKVKNHNGKNNPYPESGRVPDPRPSCRQSMTTAASHNNGSFTSYEDPTASGHAYPLRSNRSAAPTLATNPETISSDAGHSKAGTSGTAGMSRNGGDSTFSSPQHSQESLTTTLTTIQSTAPSTMLTAPPNAAHPASPVNFSHQYPTSPASAIPAHLAPHHPHTYHAATANNMLSDDASILTLASSSKRRRRRSLDTDASVRAIAPSSLFGNSRESLPLSVLSAGVESSSGIYSAQTRPGGLASAERASVYSASGTVPAVVNSERNSLIASKQGMDGASVRSGLLGHGRSESVSGSITGIATSPLASPREPNPTSLPRRSSRMSTEWKEEPDNEDADGVYPHDENEAPVPQRSSPKGSIRHGKEKQID